MDLELIKRIIEKDLSNGDEKSYKDLQKLYFYFYRNLNRDQIRMHQSTYNKKRRGILSDNPARPVDIESD